MRAKYKCPNCGAPVVKARWERGYEYCTNTRCVEKLRKVKVSIYEQPPIPGYGAEVSPLELDDIAAMYESDSDE